MREQLLTTLGCLWSGFGLYWIAVATRGRSSSTAAAPRTEEPHLFRLLRLSILATTFALLFWQRLAIGFLGRRFVPDLPALWLSGFVLTGAGLAVAVWARIYLGRYWSDKVVVQTDHKLICSGPYAHLRHPIYSGVLLGVFGTALVVGEWRGAIAFLLLLTNYAVKARKEDRLLARNFGEDFLLHEKRAGFLWPKFRGHV